MNKEYPYALYHMEGCVKEAFFLKKEPKIGEVTSAKLSIYPNGDKPVNGDKIICGSCNEVLTEDQISTGFVRRADE